jgi:glucokinase
MTRAHFPFPLLVADVGGTNARFQFVAEPDAPARAPERRSTAGHPSFADAVRSLDLPAPPRSLIACGAGPAIGKRIALTNAAWALDGGEIAEALDLDQGLLLNDFEAMAMAMAAIPEDWTRPIGVGAADPDGTRLVVGPGTGLGVGAVTQAEGRWRALPSEGGHIDLAPHGDEEAAIWRVVERVGGRITPESMLAGAGVVRLHRARQAVAGRACEVATPAELSARAFANPNGPEGDTLRHVWRMLGRVAGDLALVLLPAGGVTICGGVAAKIAPFLDEAEFRRAFEDKAPVARAVRPLSTRLLLRDEAPLEGMAAIGRRPERYALDWRARLWR